MLFLDYIWTLLEFDLLKNDGDSDTYILNSENELNEFVKKYGQPTTKTSKTFIDDTETDIINQQSHKLTFPEDKTLTTTINSNEFIKTSNKLTESNNKFWSKEPKGKINLDENKLDRDEMASTNLSEVQNTELINNLICKEIIYISNNMKSISTNIMMKAIVKNENIVSTLNELETIISLHMKKILINRNITKFGDNYRFRNEKRINSRNSELIRT